MYTVVLMAAMTSGHAMAGQHAGNPCRGCFGCYGGYPGSGYNYMVANGYQSAFSVYGPVANAGAAAPTSTNRAASPAGKGCAVSGASQEKAPAVQSTTETPEKTKAPKPKADACPKRLSALDAEADRSVASAPRANGVRFRPSAFCDYLRDDPVRRPS
jgi:hypothetical protein